MRHLVLALMIALLPVRGWVGDVMATEMASGRAAQVVALDQSAIETIAGHAHAMGEEAHSGHEHAASVAQAALPDCANHGSGDDPAPAAGHCDSCAACQACHTVALSPLTASTASLATTPELPRSPAAGFTSAVAALGQKPPIS